ncbi:MAG: GntR domain protein [Chloroflexi bacterium]|jgi:GntR family transcriptional repressor for pyruvate dehydrogenase complex|nr:GntR domain protein [Chloroflexota bacterium]MDB5076246.1 GntR domain protein [Chloroflexota bacterium]
MTLTFTPARGTTLTEAIYSQIVEAIRDGRLAVGDKLQSERELMRQFNASRASVREALRALMMARIIEVRHGSGAYVNRVTADSLLDYHTLSLLLEHDALHQLEDARLVVEVGAARMVAQRAELADLVALERTVTEMEQAAAAGDPVRFSRADIAFHDTLMQATKNDLLVKVHYVFHRLLTRVVERTVQVPGILEPAAVNHRQIYDAIVRRDADEAARLMEQKLRSSSELVDELFDSVHTPSATSAGAADRASARPKSL